MTSQEKKKQQNIYVDTGFVETQLVIHVNGGGCSTSEFISAPGETQTRSRKMENAAQ